MNRYKFEIEFNGPEPSKNFSPAILKYRVEKMILEELNRCDEFRKKQLENIYNLEGVTISNVI